MWRIAAAERRKTWSWRKRGRASAKEAGEEVQKVAVRVTVTEEKRRANRGRRQAEHRRHSHKDVTTEEKEGGWGFQQGRCEGRVQVLGGHSDWSWQREWWTGSN